ncbi:MAG: hypothetical protein JXR25_03805 [Pontiellaceae bacterium]|nr:hypothetical protein [Pontiellaceae bacterium]MBN2783926.1 hypothetical protein [Pontiellaceae bacterium]
MIGAVVNNSSDALYSLGGFGRYGHRVHESNSDANADFYSFGVAGSSQENLLKYRVSGFHAKTIDYDVRVNNGNPENLPVILTSTVSDRTGAIFDATYDRNLSDKTHLVPRYGLSYYRQSISDQSDLQWVEHSIGLSLDYLLSEQTTIWFGGGSELQLSDEEGGVVSGASLGLRRAQDKLSVSVQLGISAADYEDSGSDVGLQGNLLMSLPVTEKILVYAFAQSSHQPGSSQLGARQSSRLGYGGDWLFTDRISCSFQFLHDRQQYLQDGDVALLHFASAQVRYGFYRHASAVLAVNYFTEEIGADRSTISFGVDVGL